MKQQKIIHRRIFFSFLVCIGMLPSRCLSQYLLSNYIKSHATHIAASVGETVRFQCIAIINNTDSIAWTRVNRETHSEGLRLWTSEPLETAAFDSDTAEFERFPTTGLEDNSRHEIERYGNHFDLIIHDIQPVDAQEYSCSLLIEDETGKLNYLVMVEELTCEIGDVRVVTTTPATTEAANVTIPANGSTSVNVTADPAGTTAAPAGTTAAPAGTTAAPEVIIAEGDTMQFVCRVISYGDAPPKLTLEYDFVDNLTTEYSVQNQRLHVDNVRATTEVTAIAELNQQPFTCQLLYEGEGAETMAPIYTDSCTYSPDVLFSIRAIQVSPRPTSADGILRLMPGDSVSCSAYGNPQPRYSWFKQESNEEAKQGSELDITPDMASFNPSQVTWVCRAANSIRGKEYILEREVQLLVSSPTTTTRPTPAPTTTVEELPNSNPQAQTSGGGPALIGGVVAGIVVVIILVAVGAYVYSKKRNTVDVDQEKIVT